MDVTYGAGIVVYTERTVPESAFDSRVQRAHDILQCFRQSSPGSTWGCDGVGYVVQKGLGIIRVHKSGVGPRNFDKGMALAREKGLLSG